MKNTVLDDLKIIKKYDRSNMLETIEAFPAQCRDAKNIGYSFDLPNYLKAQYRSIVCTGLGGSAIGSDILRSYLLYEVKVPLFVNRNYLLPAFVDERTLVIVSSYSGDTEETISAYRDAKKRRAKIIVVSSGGRLRYMADRDGVPVINIPEGMPPRCATGYIFFPILIILTKMGIVKDKSRDIDRTIKVLKQMRRDNVGFTVPEEENTAKEAARALYNRYPVIYAGQDSMDCIVTRWRGELAENAKVLSSGHLFPEMNHNEIVGWENPRRLLKKFIVVILRDALDHPRISRRMDITKSLLNKEGIKVIEVSSVGQTRLARIFSLLYIGDFVSFYLAILNRTDPTPVKRITYLKKELDREI